MKQHFALSALVIGLGFASGGYGHDGNDDTVAHAVFVMTNSAHHNEVWAYRRMSNGGLQAAGRFDTGGRGSGGGVDPLGSQGALTLSQDHSELFAVNAGSGDISVFSIRGSRLGLRAVVPSGGSAPVAIAQWHDLVYVLNFAGNSNVVGFRQNEDSGLTHIRDSIRYLSAANSGAASLAFSPDGKFLLVTEKLTNNIDVFPVLPNGTLGPAAIYHDPAPGLFALTFAPDGAVMVAETGPAGAIDGGTLSSYFLDPAGTLTALSTSVPTKGAATCWDVVAPRGTFVYSSNSGSASISGFAIQGAGAISPLPGTVVASLPAGSTNLDLAITDDGKFLYTLNTGTGTIGIFAIKQDGTLKGVGAPAELLADAGFNGIAAF